MTESKAWAFSIDDEEAFAIAMGEHETAKSDVFIRALKTAPGFIGVTIDYTVHGFLFDSKVNRDDCCRVMNNMLGITSAKKAGVATVAIDDNGDIVTCDWIPTSENKKRYDA